MSTCNVKQANLLVSIHCLCLFNTNKLIFKGTCSTLKINVTIVLPQFQTSLYIIYITGTNSVFNSLTEYLYFSIDYVDMKDKIIVILYKRQYLFVHCFTSYSRVLFSHGDVTFVGEGL